MKPFDKFEGSGLVTLFEAGLGLINKVAPHRLPLTSSGVVGFTEAKNVLIGATGDVVTRQKSKLVLPGSFHSSISDGTDFYCIEERNNDATLVKIIVSFDGSVTKIGIRSNLTKNKKCSFLKVSNDIIYSNGLEKGLVVSNISYDWPDQIWTGPETSNIGEMPGGTILDILSGRLLTTVDDTLYFSEHGLLYLTDILKNSIRLENKIESMKAVLSGVFISDKSGIYFLSGQDPNSWTIKKVSNARATGVYQHLINPEDLGLDMQGLSCIFATSIGPCIGTEQGTIVSLIDKNVSIPTNCGEGIITVVDQTIILQG